MKPEEQEKDMSELTLCSKDLPALKNWKVGSTYKITLKVKMTELSECEEGNCLMAEFDIKSAKEVRNDAKYAKDTIDQVYSGM